MLGLDGVVMPLFVPVSPPAGGGIGIAGGKGAGLDCFGEKTRARWTPCRTSCGAGTRRRCACNTSTPKNSYLHRHVQRGRQVPAERPGDRGVVWHRRQAGQMYVLGFQEVVPLNAGNMFGGQDSGPALAWERSSSATRSRRPNPRCRGPSTEIENKNKCKTNWTSTIQGPRKRSKSISSAIEESFMSTRAGEDSQAPYIANQSTIGDH